MNKYSDSKHLEKYVFSRNYIRWINFYQIKNRQGLLLSFNILSSLSFLNKQWIKVCSFINQESYYLKNNSFSEKITTILNTNHPIFHPFRLKFSSGTLKKKKDRTREDSKMHFLNFSTYGWFLKKNSIGRGEISIKKKKISILPQTPSEAEKDITEIFSILFKKVPLLTLEYQVMENLQVDSTSIKDKSLSFFSKINGLNRSYQNYPYSSSTSNLHNYFKKFRTPEFIIDSTIIFGEFFKTADCISLKSFLNISKPKILPFFKAHSPYKSFTANTKVKKFPVRKTKIFQAPVYFYSKKKNENRLRSKNFEIFKNIKRFKDLKAKLFKYPVVDPSQFLHKKKIRKKDKSEKTLKKLFFDFDILNLKSDLMAPSYPIRKRIGHDLSKQSNIETSVPKGGLAFHLFAKKSYFPISELNLSFAENVETNHDVIKNKQTKTITKNKDFHGLMSQHYFGISFDRSYTLLLRYLYEMKHSISKPNKWSPFILPTIYWLNSLSSFNPNYDNIESSNFSPSHPFFFQVKHLKTSDGGFSSVPFASEITKKFTNEKPDSRFNKTKAKKKDYLFFKFPFNILPSEIYFSNAMKKTRVVVPTAMRNMEGFKQNNEEISFGSWGK